MTILDAIGNTPLIRLEVLPHKGSAEVWVNWEGANPTGSMKDRMARHMVEGAEKRGELRRGMTVVEVTGGSTGSSLALVCAMKGYRAHFVSSDAFGRITPTVRATMQSEVERLVGLPGYFWTKQFSNPDNRSSYHAMANAPQTTPRKLELHGVAFGPLWLSLGATP